MLYICATPIGNLQDITLRAIAILNHADIILCEDTRVSRHLLDHHSIKYKKLIAFHEHNETQVSHQVIKWLEDGLTIVQISDAGTPGISDPGARLCNMVLEHKLPISPLPGASAYTSILSVAGIDGPSKFFGFLPSTKTKRQEILNSWKNIDYAICIYESPHRILATLQDINDCLGSNRNLIMGRELTKQFETIKKSNVSELLNFVQNDSNQTRGEFVLIIYPNPKTELTNKVLTIEQLNALKLLLNELPPKKAVLLTHKIAGGDKDILYKHAIELNHGKNQN